MARRKQEEKKEPIIIEHDLGVNDAEWPEILAAAQAQSKEEHRMLVIINKPQHTPEETARIEQRFAKAAAAMVRSYIITFEKKIADGLASAAEIEKYRRWYAENITE